MVLITLKGDPNSGKSSVLKTVILMFLEKTDAKVIQTTKFNSHIQGLDDGQRRSVLADCIRKNWYTKTGNVSDITVIFEWKGKRFVITTQGDDYKRSKNLFEKRQPLTCFVCGCHPDQYENLRKAIPYCKEFSINSRKVPNESERCKSNTAIAEKLYNEIMKPLEKEC